VGGEGRRGCGRGRLERKTIYFQLAGERFVGGGGGGQSRGEDCGWLRFLDVRGGTGGI
jgi:hypothetical protein